MNDLISRQAAIDAINCNITVIGRQNAELVAATIGAFIDRIKALPSAEPTLRERALMLLLNWAVECDFGYDNFPEEYERYKDEIEDMSYFDGMIYIAEKEVERKNEWENEQI